MSVRSQKGTTVTASPVHHAIGPLSLIFLEGDLRRVTFHGVEVLRRLSYPVRDTSWGTLPVLTLDETLDRDATSLTYRHRFAAPDGRFDGTFTVTAQTGADGARIAASVTLSPQQPMQVNRAGFTLLHPLAGFAGAPVTLTHPDGSETTPTIPRLISAGQPARNIAALRHQTLGIAVQIAFTGEVFEMEDQRNWSDASFKTYCRPLSDPWPYTITPDAPVQQSVQITLTGSATAPRQSQPTTTQATLPQIALAHEAGLSTAPALARFPTLPVLARITPATDDAELKALARPEVTLELVVDHPADLPPLAARCTAAGLNPARVVALPRAYLKSHQPEGPWPTGPTPADLIAPLRHAFAQAQIGGGSLTNFTEFNRCPPDAQALDFVTFGTTAIVHAGDDLSVLETLEALPHIFASAAALSAGRPLRLGLMSIGMRSNPYGASVAANPDRQRLAMAMDDPRQPTAFAAAFALGLLAAAARHGVASLALGMADGPLGITAGPDLTPLAEVILAAAAMAGDAVSVTDDAGLVSIHGPRGALIANLADTARTLSLPHRARILGTTNHTTEPGTVTLAPLDVALIQQVPR
jgi:D-apionolactonase